MAPGLRNGAAARQRSPRSGSEFLQRPKALAIFVGFFVAINVFITGYAGILVNYGGDQASSGTPMKISGGGTLKQGRVVEMPAQESSVHSAGFIHIGKTAGSTISVMIRNGCSSFTQGPCRNVTNESAISKYVEHYYHVTDFWRIPESNHESFIVSVRDAFDRTVSALLYTHPENVKAYHVKLNRKNSMLGPIAYKCFPTLEDFALLQQGGNSTNCNYPYKHNNVVADDCPALACAALHGQVRFFNHLFFNYRNIGAKIPTGRKIYVIRQEHFWHDWETVNLMLGQKPPVYIPPSKDVIERNISHVNVPVKRVISDRGRTKLCKALETEYEAFFDLLSKAVNLKESDLEESIRLAERSCPSGLSFRSMVKRT